MTDVIIAILWFVAGGNWLLSAVVFYLAFNGMHSMALAGSNYGLFGAFQGIALGVALIIVGTIFGAVAVLISEVRDSKQLLQNIIKEGD
jgi:hypothetical protein